ncbi:type I-A CRISPR-associated protein Csa5 [Pyrobaculum sp. 3827-6]|uniref:type I-A CRISPR-associated protein Csa5 n=1 Tax=Pyrobaculum sp. 3827-6 TaxID=2983604 RepID=UPI0021DB69A4|nr:type I-A CRISPR-associated protein Csa5 [Pyrobaculum sp. 3827-6]MCU7786884.1 type I-A CRISPR-associated protein Csa5 [Pyrobaculum sp. 3827-6]
MDIESLSQSSVVSLLRFYVDTKQYSVVDRLAYATSPATAEYALYEAIRQIRSAKDRSIIAKRRREEKEEEVECCYYEVKKEGGEECEVGFEVEHNGVKYCCVTCPLIPREDELEKIVKAIESDLSVAAKLAALAMAYRARR